jgi:hypothetical protein
VPFNFDFDEDFRAMLKAFVLQTRDFLENLAFSERPYEYEVTFAPGTQDDIRLAIEASAPDFKEALGAVEFAREERFILAGLWGQPLIAKLRVLQWWAGQFLEGAADSFRHLIGQLNALLGSLAGATGFAEALKELKDLVASGITEIKRP